MNYLKRWLPWLLLVTLAIFGVWLNFERIAKSDTRDAFLGNLLATIIGIIAGIPIALEISRYQRHIQDAWEKATNDAECAARKQRILGLIENELVFDRNLLNAVIKQQSEKPAFITMRGLQNDSWLALSAGGELHWVDDPKLLVAIAQAYYQIRRVIFLEDKFFDPGFRMAVTDSEGKSSIAGARIIAGVHEVRKHARVAIETVLKTMGSKHYDGDRLTASDKGED